VYVRLTQINKGNEIAKNKAKHTKFILTK